LAIGLVLILKADLEALAKAAAVVAKGGIICYPTDTVYGLGCNPLNSSAVERVTAAKGGRTKPMPILVRQIQDAERLGYMSQSSRKLARKFWPGPLTIVVKAKDVLPKIIAPDGTVGLRCPRHAICLDLLGLCSGALVGTSANLVGKTPATSAADAAKAFADRVDLVLDDGKSPLGVASTVVDLTGEGFVMLREGPIGKRELMKCLRGRSQDSY
jgi:L-threonylcarbamoyladenylate synthase